MDKDNKNELSLEEATLKLLYNDLNKNTLDNLDNVDGVVDDILVVTDPDVTVDQYNDIIDNAQQLDSDTPEGDIPFIPQYAGNYLQTCPICGSTFATEELLKEDDVCPICGEQPESFVFVGQLTTDNDNDNDNDENEDDIVDEQDTTDEDEDATVDTEIDTESKHINKDNKLTESTDKDKEYTLINATPDDIDHLEKGSAFTWEGMLTDDANLQSIVEFFKENTPSIKLPVKFYTWTGETMNNLYDLSGDIAYPNNLSFVSIPLDCWSSMGNLPIIKLQVGARWLDDIVDNNARKLNREDLDETLDNKIKCNNLQESTDIEGIENLDNIADTFKYYEAYKANFKPLIIVKLNKVYYIYKSDAKSYNDYIDYSPDKEYIEGWLHGAVKAKNKIMESNQLTEDSDRINQLMNIVDDSFEVLHENNVLDESILTEAIRLTSISGITRAPEADFSDDGARFYGYMYKGVVPISYTRDGNDIYLSIAFHHLNDINYDEYSQFDSYKNADEFNGVSADRFDADEFKTYLDAAYNDIVNFRKDVKPVDNDELENRIEEINKASQEYKQKVENYIKEHAQEIINLSEYDFKKLKEYIKEAGSSTADYIREASESSKRDFLQKDLEALKKNISNSWRFSWIEEMFNKNKKDESTSKKQQVSLNDVEHKQPTLSENKKLTETGEWDDEDDEMKAWLEDMKLQANELANQIHGSVKSVHGFDKYQGPFAIVHSPIHGDVILTYDNEDDRGLSFICKIAHKGFISGGINGIAKLLNMEQIPDDNLFTMTEGKKFDKLTKQILNKGKKDGMTKDDAKAIAASIGRKKYGKDKFQKMAQKGKKTEEYDPSVFGSPEEELRYLYAWLDNRKDKMAAKYIKYGNVTDDDTLDYEINGSLQKDDAYKRINARIEELEKQLKL